MVLISCLTMNWGLLPKICPPCAARLLTMPPSGPWQQAAPAWLGFGFRLLSLTFLKSTALLQCRTGLVSLMLHVWLPGMTLLFYHLARYLFLYMATCINENHQKKSHTEKSVNKVSMAVMHCSVKHDVIQSVMTEQRSRSVVVYSHYFWAISFFANYEHDPAVLITVGTIPLVWSAPELLSRNIPYNLLVVSMRHLSSNLHYFSCCAEHIPFFTGQCTRGVSTLNCHALV